MKSHLFTSCALILIVAQQISSNPGHLKRNNAGKLGTEKKHKYDQFLKEIAPHLAGLEDSFKADFYLLRWLETKSFNVKDAVTMFVENVNWRRDQNMSNILNEDLSDVSEDFFIASDSWDKVGRPVTSIRLGSWDVRRGALQGKTSRIFRYIDQAQEKIMRNVMKAHEKDEKVDSGVLLMDLEGVNQAQHLCTSCIPILIHIIEGVESHYPGFLKEIVFTNTPSSYGGVIQIAAALVSEDTINAVKYFQKPEEWMKYFDERIDKNQRYTNFGGLKEY